MACCSSHSRYVSAFRRSRTNGLAAVAYPFMLNEITLLSTTYADERINFRSEVGLQAHLDSRSFLRNPTRKALQRRLSAA